MPLDKRSKNKTTIYHCYAFGRNTMIYGIIITRDEGQSFNHSQASVETSKNHIKRSPIFINMREIYMYIYLYIYIYISFSVVNYAVLM